MAKPAVGPVDNALLRIMEQEKVTLGLHKAQCYYWDRVMGRRMGRTPRPIEPLSKTHDPYGAAESPQ